MTVLNVCLATLMLLVVPFLLGWSMAGIMGMKACAPARCFILGTLVSWAVFEIVSVPFVLCRGSFSLLCITVSILYTALLLFGILKFRCKVERPFKEVKEIRDLLIAVGMIIVFAFVIVLTLKYTHLDDDDARFVVNALDTLKNDTMFLTNPATGRTIAIWEGELCRDVVSPWAVYQAYLAKMTMIHPTIMIHTVQKTALYLYLFVTQWELSRHFVGEKTVSRSLFCMAVWLMLLYLGYNGWTAEAFTLLRLWQGKAVIAGIGIPTIIMLLFDLYENQERSGFIQLLIANTAMCLPSNMGILFAAILTVCFALIYGILKKNRNMMLNAAWTVVPNVILTLVLAAII